nr:MAG TPA: hypothetical protein [Caudoviricetes sp.]
MENITRKSFIGLAGLSCIALATGCKGAQPEESSKKKEDQSNKESSTTEVKDNKKAEEEEKTAAIDEEIAVKTTFGDLKITVKGFETSDTLREQYNYNGNIKDDETIGTLLLLLENVSYKDQYNPDLVSLGEVITVKDADGISIHALNSASDYGKYEGAAGGSLTCKVDEKKRVAIFYLISKSMTTATVFVNKTKIEVPVTQA